MAANSEDFDAPTLSALDEEARLRVFKGWFRSDADRSREWRARAREEFDFVAGKQWSESDKQALRLQQRPTIVFNRTLAIIKAIAGAEINGRHEIRFIPRGNEDTQVNEVLSGASKWMSDGCDGEDEESTAFQHSLICGMGWTENRLDFEQEAEGKYIEEAIDPLEMYWDGEARKKNLADARRLWRVRVMKLADAKTLFPGFEDDEYDAVWASDTGGNEPAKTLEQKRLRNENSPGASHDATYVTIAQVQWWERETYYAVMDPQTGEKLELETEKFRTLQKAAKKIGIPIKYAKLTKRCYKQAFIGGVELECGDIVRAPSDGGDQEGPELRGFTFTCITGEPDHNAGTWFGLVTVMRDPQMWANKWLSQSLHILNTTAKGGILAESDAFEDQRQAEETYARPDAITWVTRNAISSNKIMAKPGAVMPSGQIELMQFAISSIRDASGVNVEMLGSADRDQPGVLESHRKQASMTILATMFDSLRRFRKMVARIRLYYIQNFLSDGRIIRITGRDGEQAVKLIRDQTIGDYDVIVDDAPTSPNQKEQNWAIIMTLLPAFKEQLVQYPDVLAEVLNASPLPSRLTETIKKAMSASAAPNENQVKAQQIAEAKAVAEIAQTQSVAELNQAKAGRTQAQAGLDLALMRKTLSDLELSLPRLRAELSRADADISLTGAQTVATHVSAAHQSMQPIPHADPHTGAPATSPPSVPPDGASPNPSGY